MKKLILGLLLVASGACGQGSGVVNQTALSHTYVGAQTISGTFGPTQNYGQTNSLATLNLSGATFNVIVNQLAIQGAADCIHYSNIGPVSSYPVNVTSALTLVAYGSNTFPCIKVAWNIQAVSGTVAVNIIYSGSSTNTLANNLFNTQSTFLTDFPAATTTLVAANTYGVISVYAISVVGLIVAKTSVACNNTATALQVPASANLSFNLSVGPIPYIVCPLGSALVLTTASESAAASVNIIYRIE
jgi:hypothetical protein